MVDTFKKDVLVIGAGGLLGKALVDDFSRTWDTEGFARWKLDIVDWFDTLAKIKMVSPRVIVLSAAYTDVDGCEKDIFKAAKVNTQGPSNVAKAAREIGAALIYISTDYVFDGEAKTPYQETDATQPLGVYGVSKLQGEQAVLSTINKAIVIRSSWLFGEGKKGFIPFVLESLKEKKPMKVVADKFGCCTYVVDLASGIRNIISLILKNQYDFKNNVLHVTNSGVCSWYDMAVCTADALGMKDVVISKTTLAEFPFKARRPRYSAMDNGRFNAMTGKPLRAWQEALKEFVTHSHSRNF